jgi:hypothetical protein
VRAQDVAVGGDDPPDLGRREGLQRAHEEPMLPPSHGGSRERVGYPRAFPRRLRR